MDDFKAQGTKLKQQREAQNITQKKMLELVQKADPTLTASATAISDIECGRSVTGPKMTRIRELMQGILSKKSAAVVGAAKKITLQPHGFSFEASTSAVKQLAALGVPTADVKALLVKTFAEMLDQAEK